MNYYLSDANMMFDGFFHKLASQNADGYISIDHFMNCKKIIAAGCTSDELLVACDLSAEIDVKDKEIRRKDNKALPELRKRESKKENRQQQQYNDVVMFAQAKFEREDEKGVHMAVKNGVIRALEAKYQQNERPKLEWTFKKGSLTGTDNVIPMFFIKKTSKDLTFIEDKMPFQAKFGETDVLDLHLEPVSDEIKKQMWMNAPAYIKKKAQSEIKNKEFAKPTKTIEGYPGKFRNVRELTMKIKEISNARTLGEEIATDKKDYKFLEAVLKHHPNQKKTEGMVGIKVDAFDDKNSSRCFYMIRADGTTDNVSLVKCCGEIEKMWRKQDSEPKAAEPIKEAKAEEPVKEEVKEEVKAEEPVKMEVEEVKAEEPVKEEVKEEVKAEEPVKEEVKEEVKAEEPVKEEVKEEVKAEEPVQEEAKVEEKTE